MQFPIKIKHTPAILWKQTGCRTVTYIMTLGKIANKIKESNSRQAHPLMNLH